MTRARRSRREVFLLLATAVALQAIVWALMIALLSARVGYGLHDLSDVPHYLWFAEQVDAGAWPYTDFRLEYPPLSLAVFLVPPRDGTLATYEAWFAAEMIAVFATSAVVVALTAMRLWPGLGRPLAATAAFAAAVALAGGIGLNRFDPAVGLVVAVSVLAMVHGRLRVAAAVAGLGFALKLVPATLVPLVLILAERARAWILAIAAAAALLPFVPFVLREAGGLGDTVGSQSLRGLQIESLAATPYLVLAAVRQGGVRVVVPPGGSLVIEAPGTALWVRLAPFVVVALLALVYLFVWRARAHLRAHADSVPAAALAALLAFLCGNKVLSPQHILWILPLVALSVVSDGWKRRAAGTALLVASGLTQVDFPAHYFGLRDLETLPIVLVVARNVLLLAAFMLLLAALWETGSRGRDAS